MPQFQLLHYDGLVQMIDSIILGPEELIIFLIQFTFDLRPLSDIIIVT